MSKSTQNLTTKTNLSGTDRVAFVRNEAGVWKDYAFTLADVAKVNSKSDTYANITTDKSNGDLIANSWYFISDKNIYLQAISATEFGLQGYINGYDSDYQNGGDYSDVTIANGFTVNATGTNRGIWFSTFVSGGGTLNTGDVMIYNDTHYLSKTGAIGTAPSGDTTNWEVVANSTDPETRGYILNLDIVYYNFAADSVLARWDRVGNEVYGSSLVDLFPWGNSSFVNNRLDYPNNDLTITGLYNHRGDFRRNEILGGTFVTDEDASCDITDMICNRFDSYNFSDNVNPLPYRYLGRVLHFGIHIETAEVLTLNSSPVLMVDNDSACAISVLNAEAFIDYNSVAYATNTTLALYTNSASNKEQFGSSSFLAATADSFIQMVRSNIDNALVVENDLYAFCKTGDPTAGNSPVYVTGSYTMIAPDVMSTAP